MNAAQFRNIALTLSADGLWCFPVAIVRTEDGHCDKRPLVAWKPYQERPPSQLELNDWCSRFPAAGGGIPTGSGTNVFVVDADNADAIEWLNSRAMPHTWVCRTPRGAHFYFRYPTDIEVRNSSGAIAPGVDVRGAGGFVVAPGSCCFPQPGQPFTYHWEPGRSPSNGPLAAAPDWLLHEIERVAVPMAPAGVPQPYRGQVRAWARKALDANLELLRTATPGTRNTTAAHVACRLGRICGAGELEADQVLAALNTLADCWPNAAHTRDTIARAFAAGCANPAVVPATTGSPQPGDIDP